MSKTTATRIDNSDPNGAARAAGAARGNEIKNKILAIRGTTEQATIDRTVEALNRAAAPKRPA
jgi:hypothetical protein